MMKVALQNVQGQPLRGVRRASRLCTGRDRAKRDRFTKAARSDDPTDP
jgi:hypothetical protein